jgi:hypothetical protein
MYARQAHDANNPLLHGRGSGSTMGDQGQQGQQELVQIMRELEQTQRQMLTELRLIRILFQTLFSGSGNP